jgi:hypothetical protein
MRLLLVTAAFLAGCGGGAGFSERAASICTGANASVRRLGPEPAILTERHARWILRQTGIDLRAVARLGRLEPPAAARAAFDAMLRDYRRGLGEGPAIARADRHRDQAAFRATVVRALNRITDGQLAAAKLRLRGCDRIGSVAR